MTNILYTPAHRASEIKEEENRITIIAVPSIYNIMVVSSYKEPCNNKPMHVRLYVTQSEP